MVMLNHIENIAIHPIGLGDENTQKPFFRPPDGESLTGSFEKNFRSDNAYAGELEIQRGDDAFAKAQIKSPSIIKIDIESYEKLALRGLRETLARNRPIVVFEMTIDPNSPVTIKSKDELSTLFPDRYEFARISETGDPSSGVYILGSIDGITFDRYQQHDLLAFPSERKNSIPRHGPNH
jgi:FkbM family methyltransferase